MSVSIKKSFFNLKTALFISFFGALILALYLIHISTFMARIDNIKEQQVLIDKAIHTDLSDPKMASILLNDTLSRIALLNKRLSEPNSFDFLFSDSDDEIVLMKQLNHSAQNFQDSALFWSESLNMTRETSFKKMLNSRNNYLNQISLLHTKESNNILELMQSVKYIAISLLFFNLLVWVLYRFRLNQVLIDIENSCSADYKENKFHTEEFDFIGKRLLRKAPIVSSNSIHIHQPTELYNEKGIISIFNAKKVSRSANNVFLTLFEIDQYSFFQKLSIENRYAIIKKIGETVSMYEQSLDIVGYLEKNDRIVFISSRLNRQLALDDAEKIRETVEESSFNTDKGPIKITLSGGILLKVPAKSIDEIIDDAADLIQKAHASGGNQIGRIR